MRTICLSVVAGVLWFGSFVAAQAPAGPLARIGGERYHLSPYRRWHQPLLSPDGQFVAVYVPTFGVEIWKLPEWQRFRFISVEIVEKDVSAKFESLAFTPDSKQLVLYDANSEKILIYDGASGKIVKTLTPKQSGPFHDSSLLVAADQKTLIFSWYEVGTQMQVFLAWDLARNVAAEPFRSPTVERARFVQFAVAPDGRRLVRNDGRNLEIWDLPSAKLHMQVGFNGALVTQMVFSPDGRTLATVDSVVRILDVEAGKERDLRGQTAGHLEFSRDGFSLFVANSKISRWNVADLRLLHQYDCPVDCAVTGLRTVPDGAPRAVGVSRNTVFSWEVATGKLLSPTDVPSGAIGHIAFSPQGDLFISAQNGYAGWWNPRAAAKLRALAFSDPARPFSRPNGLKFRMAGNGEYFAYGGEVPIFVAAKTGTRLYDPKQLGPFSNYCFIADGNKLATLERNKVKLWDIATGKREGEFATPVDPRVTPTAMAMSADGRYLALATDLFAHVRFLVWDTQRRQILENRELAQAIENLAFSPDGRWLAYRSGKAIRLMRLAYSRDDDYLIEQPDAVITQFAFSPDGRQLAYAASDELPKYHKDSSGIFVYELASKQIRLELPGHRAGTVEHLAYAADSGLLASAATDTAVLVWAAGLRAVAANPAKGAPADKDLADWYAQMASTDAKAAFQGMIKLCQASRQTVKLLEQRLMPAAKLDTEGRSIAQWIGDLGSRQFAVRGKANAILQKLGPAAEPDLRAALLKKLDLETARRIEELLARLARREPSPEEVLHTRAVELLEAIATPDARAALTRWATGEPAAVLTQHSRQALARWPVAKK